MARIGLDVRRLAAVDMHGLKGTRLRRRIILAEFVLGAIVGPTIGVMLLFSSGLGWKLFGLWLLGAGLNYVPLALHALALSRPGVLEAELAGADVARELRYYTTEQVWVFVPLALVVLAVRQMKLRST